ncbi:MAG: hypothetical protein ACUVTZ_11505 [Armatimonadota bacterium]
MSSLGNVMRLWVAISAVGALVVLALPVSAEISDKVRDRIRERSRSQTVPTEVKAPAVGQSAPVGGLLGGSRARVGPGPALPRSTPLGGGIGAGAPASPGVGGLLDGRSRARDGIAPATPRKSWSAPVQPSTIVVTPPAGGTPRVSPGGVLGGSSTVGSAPRMETGSASPAVSGVLGGRRDADTSRPAATRRSSVVRRPGELLGGSRPVVPAVPRGTAPSASGSVSARASRADVGVGRAPTVGSVLGESRATRRIVTYGPGRRTTRSGRVVVIPPPTYKHVSVYLGFGTLFPEYHLRLPGVSVSYFYYPYYAVDPFVPGYRVFPSLYYYYATVPRYIYGPSVIVLERPTYIIERRSEVYVDDDVDYYYLSPGLRTSLKETLDDIRDAWVHGEFDLLLRHLHSEGKIHVSIRGKYAYSLTPEDYRDMTKDAVENTDTKSFEWVRTEKLSDDEVIAKARHEFLDKDGERRTVYATYRLKQDHGVWWIVGVGTSNRLSDD